MSEKILVLEDEPEATRLIQAVLEPEGFEILPARNTAEAHAILFSKPITLALVDLLLPDKNGLEFVKEIRSRPIFRYAGVLILSAKSQLQDRLNGFAAGADDYLSKPFSPQELLERIKAVLRFVSPLHHPQSCLPSLLAFHKECGKLEEKDSAEFWGITLTEYESFKTLFPDRVQLLMKEISQMLYKEMALLNMVDFLSHVEDDLLVLVSANDRAKTLLEGFKKDFPSLRKKLLRQSALDYFKKPPQNILDLKIGKLNVEVSEKINSEKILEKLNEFKKSFRSREKNGV